jgi:lipid-A-disaccharide synthase
VAKVKYISLPNLIMDKSMIKELIQDEMNEEKLKNELSQITRKTTKREKMIHDFEELKNVLGGSGASKRIAQKLIDYLKTN